MLPRSRQSRQPELLFQGSASLDGCTFWRRSSFWNTGQAVTLFAFLFMFTLPCCSLAQKANLRSPVRKNNETLPVSFLRFPLHQKSGTQHVHIWIGEPPVRQTLIVDTGSRFTATICQGCLDCGIHANSYLPDASWTRFTHTCNDGTSSHNNNLAYAPPAWVMENQQQQHQHVGNSFTLMGCRAADRCVRNVCEIAQKYTEGSTWKATEVNDIVALGEERLLESTWDGATAFSFGCQTQVKGLFRKQYADGILGLLRTEHSLVQTMQEQGVIHQSSFSLCLHKDGGWIALGGPQTDRHHEMMQFTETFEPDEHVWHSVVVRQVWLGKSLIADEPSTPRVVESFSEGKGTILDSGTTDTFLPSELEELLAAAWKEQTGVLWTQRTRDYTYQEFQSLPSIHLVLEGNLTMSLLPLNYMEGARAESWEGRRRLVNRVYADERIGAVLGLNAMVGYDIYYDGTRIGLARADCV